MGTKTSNNNSARAAHFLVHFFAVTVRLPREIPIFRLGKIATKFEKTPSPFNSDVLVFNSDVTDAVAKASL